MADDSDEPTKIAEDYENNAHEDSETLFPLQIRYSYSLSEVSFLFLKMYQLSVKRYYHNVIRSITVRRKKKSKKGRIEKMLKNFEEALEKIEDEEKKEREKRVCIHVWCFIRFTQNYVLLSLESGFKDFQVSNLLLI